MTETVNQVLNQDTIVAIASGSGKSGVGIVRLSGNQARVIGETITSLTLTPRYAHYTPFKEQHTVIDQGIVLFFKAPFSFTGEDVIELQAHGGPIILNILLNECVRLGARMATPGEFSERAFLNGKIDLTQAEAIADLIDASSEQAARSAVNTLQGQFSDKIHALVDQVIRLRVYIEAAIDFPEEEIDFLADDVIKQGFEDIELSLSTIISESKQGQLLKEGIKLVIIGKPNAGKSSLLNVLAKKDIAIVTPIQGTTRDTLKEHILLDGLPVHIIDTAGLRETSDVIEQEGIKRAQSEVLQADVVMMVNDIGENHSDQSDQALIHTMYNEFFSPDDQAQLNDTPVILVHNKCDLTTLSPTTETHNDQQSSVYISAKESVGLDLLINEVKRIVNFKHMDSAETNVFSARERHCHALNDAQKYLLIGKEQLFKHKAGELVAEDLKQCQAALDQITGAFSSDALLGEIFSSFCIGK